MSRPWSDRGNWLPRGGNFSAYDSARDSGCTGDVCQSLGPQHSANCSARQAASYRWCARRVPGEPPNASNLGWFVPLAVPVCAVQGGRYALDEVCRVAGRQQAVGFAFPIVDQSLCDPDPIHPVLWRFRPHHAAVWTRLAAGRPRIPACVTLRWARTMRCATVDSETRSARAICALVSPHTARKVRAIWPSGASAGQQHMKINSRRLSGSLGIGVLEGQLLFEVDFAAEPIVSPSSSHGLQPRSWAIGHATHRP